MKLVPTEYQECLSYFRWAQFNPILREYLIHLANEGKRNAITGSRLKLIGLRAGIPDYVLPYPSSKYHCLWIEMKRSNHANRAKRDNQNEWIDKLNKIGHYACYCYGWEHAAEITRDYLADKL